MPPNESAAGQQNQQPQSFTPLEYWKPPKAVKHIRKKSAALLVSTGLIKSPDRHSFRGSNLEDGIREDYEPDGKDMAFGRYKNSANAHVQMTDDYGRSVGPPPAYKLDREDTLHHPWYNFKYWGKRGWLAFAAVVVAIIVIIIVIAVVEVRANRYPDYSELSYTLSETCTFFASLLKIVG